MLRDRVEADGWHVRTGVSGAAHFCRGRGDDPERRRWRSHVPMADGVGPAWNPALRCTHVIGSGGWANRRGLESRWGIQITVIDGRCISLRTLHAKLRIHLVYALLKRVHAAFADIGTYCKKSTAFIWNDLMTFQGFYSRPCVFPLTGGPQLQSACSEREAIRLAPASKLLHFRFQMHPQPVRSKPGKPYSSCQRKPQMFHEDRE